MYLGYEFVPPIHDIDLRALSRQDSMVKPDIPPTPTTNTLTHTFASRNLGATMNGGDGYVLSMHLCCAVWVLLHAAFVCVCTFVQ